MSVVGLLLGVINIAIVVAVLVLVGYLFLMILSWLTISLPPMVQKLYLVIIALIALYMFVQLLVGGTVPWAPIHRWS